MTPKQTLFAHMEKDHKRRRHGKHITYRELQAEHAAQHHRLGGLNHWHGVQANLGPDQRPEGWYTGEHVYYKG